MELVKVKTKDRKRIGRGLSSGQGKTAGRGTKGQKSRSGYNLPNRYAGGESPLSLRLPKLPGFKSHNKKAVVITLDHISKSYKDNETVSGETLVEKGLVRKGESFKILNTGALLPKIKLGSDVKISNGAKILIESFSAKEEKKAEKGSEPTEKPAKKSKKSE